MVYYGTHSGSDPSGVGYALIVLVSFIAGIVSLVIAIRQGLRHAKKHKAFPKSYFSLGVSLCVLCAYIVLMILASLPIGDSRPVEVQVNTQNSNSSDDK